MNPELRLSPQQTIIMQALVDGFTVKEIAYLMNLSSHTVKNYIKLVKRKINAKTYNHMIALVVARGYVTVNLNS